MDSTFEFEKSVETVVAALRHMRGFIMLPVGGGGTAVFEFGGLLLHHYKCACFTTWRIQYVWVLGRKEKPRDIVKVKLISENS